MQSVFVSYDLALLAKNKKFDEKCLGYFNHRQNFYFMTIGISNSDAKQALPDGTVAAPLYQQIIDWFEDKHDIQVGYIKGHQEGSCIREYFPMLDRITDLIDGCGYSNRLEALNKAIEEAFKLI